MMTDLEAFKLGTIRQHDYDNVYTILEAPKEAYVNVYDITRHYGGPEEGGWWYNQMEPILSYPVTPKNVDEHMARLSKEYDKDGNIYSVNGTNTHSVVFEFKAAERYPEERPYYC